MNQVSSILITAFICIFIFMSSFWYIGKKIKNYAIVDVAWATALVLLCAIYFFMGDSILERRVLILSMVCFWGLRLGGYLLFTRILGGHGEDERYANFRKDYGDKADRKFFTNIFMFQGALDIFLSLPFLLVCINPNPEIQVYEFFGFVLFIIALAGESIADRQLHQFKAKPENKGKNCEIGLWYYSRHPNYFFEWLVWVSYFLVSISPSLGWIGFLGILPMILMYIFLTKFSGVPMAEKLSLEKRGDVYREYQKTTSPFIPWFKKR